MAGTALKRLMAEYKRESGERRRPWFSPALPFLTGAFLKPGGARRRRAWRGGDRRRDRPWASLYPAAGAPPCAPPATVYLPPRRLLCSAGPAELSLRPHRDTRGRGFGVPGVLRCGCGNGKSGLALLSSRLFSLFPCCRGTVLRTRPGCLGWDTKGRFVSSLDSMTRELSHGGGLGILGKWPVVFIFAQVDFPGGTKCSHGSLCHSFVS